MAPLEADPEAAHSLRPSAGGARVGTASRAHAVAPPPRRDGLLNRHASVAGPGPGASRAGLVPGRSETRAPSTESLLSILVRLVRRVLHRGMLADLATRLHPLHPCHEKERSPASSRPTTFHLAGRRVLAGPFGSPRSRRQDVTSPLLQPTFTSRALDIDSTSGGCPPAVVSKPTTPGFEADPRGGEMLPPRQPGVDAGPPRGHPASSGCALDGTPAGFGSIDAAWTLSRPCGRAPALFRLTGRLVDRTPLIPASGERSWSR
jgi:hypothetical protein